jgi:hypothetical protein
MEQGKNRSYWIIIALQIPFLLCVLLIVTILLELRFFIEPIAILKFEGDPWRSDKAVAL